MLRLVALLTALLLISSDSAPAQSDEEALRSELPKVVESLNSGGGSAALDFFSDHYVTESTRFHLVGGLDRGWNTERLEGLRRSFASGLKTDLREEILDLRIHGDIGVTVGLMHGTATYSDGQTFEGPIRFTYVWIKTNGKWKELHHHVSVQN